MLEAEMLAKLKGYSMQAVEQTFRVLDDESYFVEHDGYVTCSEVSYSGDTRQVIVGSYEAYTLLATEAVKKLDPVTDVCGELLEGVLDAGRAIYECVDGSYTESFRPEHGIGWKGGDVLVIHSLELDDEHRGIGLGLVVLDTLIRRFGGGSVLALVKPFPLHSVDTSDSSVLGPVCEKLRAYYGLLGFWPLKDAPEYMALDIIGHKRLGIEDVLLGRARKRA